jgi:hypothetical protein
MVSPKKVVVAQNADAEVPTEVLADSIVAIAAGIKKLRAGRLNDRALYLLIQHAAPGAIAIREIKSVIEGMESLERVYLRKKPQP